MPLTTIMAEEIKNNNGAEEAPQMSAREISEQMQIRRNKLVDLRAMGRDPYVITKFDRTHVSSEILANYDELEGKDVVISGRMMLKRVMGKASFAHVLDSAGQIQIYVQRDSIGEEDYKLFKTYDIGDLLGIKGYVFKTKTGETSVHVTELTLLAKALNPLPEKKHGLKDVDTRYRQRYLDMVVNPEVKEVFIKRSKIISEIRRFLESRGYMEVETPVLHSIAGGAAARPFITHHNTLDIDMYLRIALELHLKRLIVGGFDKVYEIGRVFRNEGMDTRHNPEFTLLELYEAYTDYNGMMDITEAMFKHVAKEVLGTLKFNYGDIEIDFEKPFARLSMSDAVKAETGIDFTEITDLEEARAIAKKHHVEYEERHGIGDILNLFFEDFCEAKIVQPTFVMHHPVEISPLAKKRPEDPRYTERFELFIMGSEYGNAFSELNDPIDQRERFEHQAAMKAAGDDEACDVDEDFLNALELGMPPTGGLGIGIDRLTILLTNAQSIRDVLLFPTMKPISD